MKYKELCNSISKELLKISSESGTDSIDHTSRRIANRIIADTLPENQNKLFNSICDGGRVTDNQIHENTGIPAREVLGLVHLINQGGDLIDILKDDDGVIWYEQCFRDKSKN